MTHFSSIQATVGIDFLTKTIYVDDKMVRMQIWDTAGQEKFHCLIPQYIQDSSVAVVTYDITCKYPSIIQSRIYNSSLYIEQLNLTIFKLFTFTHLA